MASLILRETCIYSHANIGDKGRGLPLHVPWIQITIQKFSEKRNQISSKYVQTFPTKTINVNCVIKTNFNSTKGCSGIIANTVPFYKVVLNVHRFSICGCWGLMYSEKSLKWDMLSNFHLLES